MRPEVVAWGLIVLAILLLIIWLNDELDAREEQSRLPRWDGSPQAYPATVEARIDLLIRSPRLAAQLEEEYPS